MTMRAEANDLRLVWAGLASDCAMLDGDLAAESGLETAVILSLFCDARAREDDVIPDGTGYRRGWWADSVAPLASGGLTVREDAAAAHDRIGSRLWLLSREKQLPEVLRRAKDYAEEALAWLIDDGVARRVSVTPSVPRQGWLWLDISIDLADGGEYRQGLDFPL